MKMRKQEALTASLTGFWFVKTTAKVAEVWWWLVFFLKKAKESFVKMDEKQDNKVTEDF